MNNTSWILLDTETNGLVAPIYVVELAAQRMRGWEAVGEPFRRLLNQNVDIPPEASRVNGYTREILERDGEPALEVYADFARYVDGLPLVSYNLEYDLDKVLLPEWARLGLAPIGTRGFCALELARRLLDPVPAGNCKLQTLRQFYRLPERGAHTGLGDVLTVVDLLGQVLRPLLRKRGLLGWEAVLGFTTAEWFPQRLVFGKFKGRDFRDARKDADLHQWLIWLAESSNARSAAMGCWYLARLDHDVDVADTGVDDVVATAFDVPPLVLSDETGLALFAHPELQAVRQWVASARERLAGIEAEYTEEHMAVQAMQATLFGLLRAHYQERDRKKLLLSYREKYLETLLKAGRDEARAVAQEYQQAQAQADAEYEQAAAEAETRRELSEDEAKELKTLYRKLVRLFHPDRYAHDPVRQEVYQQLTQEINRAKDEGNIERLREIAQDPDAFMLRQYGRSLDFSDEAELAQSRRLFEALQHTIMEMLEALDDLRASSDYDLYQLSRNRPSFIEELAEDYTRELEAEITQLDVQLAAVGLEIATLTRV